MSKNGISFEEINNNTKMRTNNINNCFFSLPPQQFSLLSGLIGVFLTYNLNLKEQNSLGNFLVGIGQALLTAAAQGDIVQKNIPQNQNIHQEIKILQNQISLLEQKINGKLDL